MQNAITLARSAWNSLTGFARSIPLGAWIAAFALAGGLLGLGGFTFAYASGYAYLSDDPAACSNCHVMREVYDGWNRSPHHAVATCNDCHTPHDWIGHYAIKAINGWNHSSAFTLGNFEEPIRIKSLNRAVTQQACLECHGDLTISIDHRNGNEPTDCLTCHAGAGHGK